MKKNIFIICVFVLVIAGCGGGGDSSSSDNQPPPPATDQNEKPQKPPENQSEPSRPSQPTAPLAPEVPISVAPPVRTVSPEYTGPETQVLRNPYQTWGGGMLIGRPRASSNRGYLFKTMEMNIDVGAFSDDPRFVGLVVNVSTERSDVFEAFDKLDVRNSYVFNFLQKHDLNPEIEDSNTQIVSIEPLKNDFFASGLPTEMNIVRGRKGTYSKGEKEGRIIGVMRWGVGRQICTVIVGSRGVRPSWWLNWEIAEAGMNIYSEQGCKFAEGLLRYGADVRVAFEQDFFEIWDMNNYIIRKVTVTAVPIDEENVALPVESQTKILYLRFDEQAYRQFIQIKRMRSSNLF